MRIPLVLLLTLLSASQLSAQEFGVIRGRVTGSDGTAAAAVTVRSSVGHAEHTAPDGSYVLTRVPAGDVVVTAARVGLQSATQRVEVGAGAEVRLDFFMRAACLDCSGDMEIIISDPLWEPKAFPDTVLTAKQPTAASATMSELLASRSPSVIVRASGGTLGAGSRLYLRGVSSVNYRATPLVVVDGIRYVSDPGALLLEVGGQTPSRLDDLDPEEVEEVVVLPGPAAAARYGPDGANGALEVRTRRPSGTALRVSGFVEAGLRADPNRYPQTWSRIGLVPEGERVIYCSLVAQAVGQCTPFADSLRSVNQFENGAGLRNGAHRRARAAVEGGGSWGMLRASADVSRTEGVQENEGWDRRRFHLAGIFRPHGSLEVDASLLRSESVLDLAHGDNTVLGYQFAALAFGPGDFRTHPDWIPPVTQDAAHTTAAARVTWTARDWLQLGVRGGIDRAGRDETWDVTPPPPDLPLRADADGDWTRRTLAATATATYPVRWVNARSTLQLERWSDRRVDGEDIRSGSATSGYERVLRSHAVGLSLAQVVEARRYGASAVLRRDGVVPDDNGLWSGSVAGHVVAVDRPVGPVHRLVVRGAYGWLGRPFPQEYTPICDPFTCTDPQPRWGARSREKEVGLDLTAGRVSLGVTGYRRTTDEPIWALDESFGRFDIRNSGWEGHLRADALRRRNLQLSVELLGWKNRNRVTGVDDGPINFNGGAQTIREGYALGAYFGRPIRAFTDRNGDGVLGAGACPGPNCEVELDNTAIFLGSALPDHGLTLGTEARIGGRVVVTARIEHQGGNKQLNRTALYQCVILTTCRASLDPTTSLQEQAYVIAARRGSIIGFLEDGSFTRLRELSVKVGVPPSLVRMTGAGGMDLVVAGRNLITWTGYSGMDPEVNFTGSGDPLASGEFLTQPNPRVWTMRLEIHR